jgi:hypothetical protein
LPPTALIGAIFTGNANLYFDAAETTTQSQYHKVKKQARVWSSICNECVLAMHKCGFCCWNHRTQEEWWLMRKAGE